jgi:alkylation response protein AidB-like acyl-CoA dehydrogenase
MLDIFMDKKKTELMNKVRDFVKWVPKKLLTDMDDNKVTYPGEYVREAAKRKLLGLRFDPAYGGGGLKWEDEIIAIEEIGLLGTSLACLYSLVSIVGEALNVFGTDAQKKKYLTPLLEGKIFCAEALTEPRGGSDFFGATTVARKEGGHWILNGQKRFVVGAEGADIFLVYAKTDEKAKPQFSLSVFVVERDMGVEVKHLYGLLGTRGGGAGRIIFKNAKVPDANLIGEVNAGGLIFNQMMIPERMTSASGCLGGAREMLRIAAKYSDKRKAFGQKIRNYQGVSFKVADSIMEIDAACALVHAAACAVDEHGSTGTTRRLVSEAKRYATEMNWRVVNNAMQIVGGIGYTNVFPIEKALRDARLSMIWTGTSEIMNLIIQHEYYKEILGAEPGKIRDLEEDAADADKAEEKIYE